MAAAHQSSTSIVSLRQASSFHVASSFIFEKARRSFQRRWNKRSMHSDRGPNVNECIKHVLDFNERNVNLMKILCRTNDNMKTPTTTIVGQHSKKHIHTLPAHVLCLINVYCRMTITQTAQRINEIVAC